MKYRISCKTYVFSVFFLLLSMSLVSSCSDLHFTVGYSDCISGDRDCTYKGDTTLLYKEPMDVLIVLDNSKKAKDINPHILANLNQFLQCMKPIGWKVGVVSGVYDRSESETFGQLMRMEVNGLLSSKNSLNQHDDNYSQIFHNTISLESGCASPPFCSDGKLQPLNAIKSFMDNQQESRQFLREQTPLSTIVISSSEKQRKPLFSSAPASSQELLSFLQRGYYGQPEHFISLAALPPGTAGDCVITKGDVLFAGAQELNKMGQVYAFSAADPMAFLASTIIGDIIISQFHKDEKIYDIARFAHDTGGKVVDLCSPHFGKALAYLIFQKLGVQNKFPNECRSIYRNRESTEQWAGL